MKNTKGFTLVELICVITVLVTLFLVAIPSISNTVDKWILDSTARQIVEDIRWAQYLSITDALSHYFELDIANRFYRIKSIDLNAPVIKKVDFNSDIRNITTSLESKGKFHRLTFAATGIPGRTGSIILTSKQGREKTITIAVGTGRVVIKN